MTTCSTAGVPFCDTGDAAPRVGHGVPSGQMVSVPRIEWETAYRGMMRYSTPCFLMTNFHLHFEPSCAIAYFLT